MKSHYSLFWQFQTLYRLPIDFNNKIILVYVSLHYDVTKSELLPELKEEISKLSNKRLKKGLKYGAVSTESNFINRDTLVRYFPLYFPSISQ